LKRKGAGTRNPTSYLSQVPCIRWTDLKVLDSRPKVSFSVDEEILSAYRERLTLSGKKKQPRKMMKLLPREWHDAYEAGSFTGFRTTALSGHTYWVIKFTKKVYLIL
jgi:hypothetical protein